MRSVLFLHHLKNKKKTEEFSSTFTYKKKQNNISLHQPAQVPICTNTRVAFDFPYLLLHFVCVYWLQLYIGIGRYRYYLYKYIYSESLPASCYRSLKTKNMQNLHLVSELTSNCPIHFKFHSDFPKDCVRSDGYSLYYYTIGI